MRRQISIAALTLALLTPFIGACTSADTKKQRHFSRANEYYAKGDFAHAAIEYRSALQSDDKFGQARYRLALSYQRVGDLSRALQEIVRAADLMPEAPEVQLSAGNLLLMAEQFEDAASRAQHVLDRDPRNLKALLLLGNASGRLKNSDKALETLERAIKELPNEAMLHESLGVLEIGRGNRSAAEGALKRAVEVAPTSAEAREALAMYYWSSGLRDDAERTFKEALTLEGAGATVSLDLAVFYLLEGRNKEAEPYLVKLLNQSPKDASLRVALGDVYARDRRFDDALKTYEPLTKDRETFASASARMAYAEYRAGRKNDAYRRLHESIGRAPKDSDLQTMLARLFFADRKFSDAEITAKAALQTTPDRFEATYALGSALARQGRDDEALPILQRAATLAPRRAGPKLEVGRIFLSRGDLTSALQYAQDAVAADPKQPSAQLLLARVFIAQRNVNAAEKAVKALVSAFPDSPDAQTAAGDVALMNTDLSAARQAYSRALELRPDSADALNGLVTVQLAQGKGNDALALMKRTLGSQTKNPRILMLAARTFFAMKDARQAEALLLKAIEISPASALEAYGMLAGFYFQQNRLDEARARFEAVARMQPKDVSAPTMLGVILQLQGQPKEAQAVYERLLQTYPDTAVAANNLAMLLLESGGNLDVALNYAQAASKGLPNDPDISDTLGLVYWKKGLSSLAVSAFEASTTARPNNPEFWLHLGQAYAGAGNKVKAREALQRALKLNPQFSGAVKALEDLNKRA